MTDEWIPPSKRTRFVIDYEGLGIPRRSYGIPQLSAYWSALGENTTPEDASTSYKTLEAHLRGEIPLGDLPERDVRFLKNYFGQQIAEQRDRAIEFFTNRVPRRYAGAAPDAAATAWATAVSIDPDGTRSLLVVGPTGTGKTHYAYSVLRAYAETGAVGWRALTAADLYASLRPRAGQDSEAEFDKVADAGLLFVDDLAAAKLTEWTEEITYRLINRRYEKCLPGIFTSNVPPQELRDALGERVASRLTEMCERVILRGDDRRKGRAA